MYYVSGYLILCCIEKEANIIGGVILYKKINYLPFFMEGYIVWKFSLFLIIAC